MELINRIRKSRKGFTLVEIIVVLVILAILAAFTIPAMLGFVNDAKGKARIAQAREVYVAAQAAATERVATFKPAAATPADILSAAELADELKATATAATPPVRTISNASMKTMLDDDIPSPATWTVVAEAKTAGTLTTEATGKIESIELKIDGKTITVTAGGSTVVTTP